VDNAQHQDVVATVAILPGCTVNRERPRLWDIHQGYNQLGNGEIVQLKLSKEAMEAFEVGFGFGLAHKRDSQFAQVDGSGAKEGNDEEGKKGDSGTMPVKVGLQSLAN
jgi:hypothetical protein